MTAYAPANIALIKYWGKRNHELNLPITNSLSMSLEYGTHTSVKISSEDAVWLNGKRLNSDDTFHKRLFSFCDRFRDKETFFHIETKNEIPTAAGFASSSSGFAALVLALNNLYGWNHDARTLSILARLGSGSASRSIYKGFVEWQAGVQDDGLDSFSVPLNIDWPELQIGLITISDKQKPIDSRAAMRRTVETSTLYKSWPEQVARDLITIKDALYTKNFNLLGQTAEQNALAMHATMASASPAVLYWQPESVAHMHKIWQLRAQGLDIYFTMDAGPNIKLLYQKKDLPSLQETGLLPKRS